MRGIDTKQSSMLCLMSPEGMVPERHPARRIKEMADGCLATMSAPFDAMYAGTGRPSIPPERLLKASLLMALYSVRSERQFCEQLSHDLLFRWCHPPSSWGHPLARVMGPGGGARRATLVIARHGVRVESRGGRRQAPDEVTGQPATAAVAPDAAT